MSEESFYDILGVPKNASAPDIKKAYRKLSKKYHPDANLDDTERAEIKMQQLNEAKGVLMDEERRQIYDRYGREGLEGGMRGPSGPGGMGDIFAQMMRQQQMHQQQQPQVAPIQIMVEVSVRDAYHGKKITKTFKRSTACTTCNETGFKDKIDHTCSNCNGTGHVMHVQQRGPMIQQIQMQCNQCQGKGMDSQHPKCGGCHGKKVMADTFTFNTTLPAGMYDGYVHKVKNEGNQLPKTHRRTGSDRGEIYVIVKEQESEFVRGIAFTNQRPNSTNVLKIEKISLAESLCGFQRKINHPKGETLLLEENDLIKHDDVKIIPGEGFPTIDNNSYGDLYVQYKIEYPDTELDEDAKTQMWALLSTEPYVNNDGTGIGSVKAENYVRGGGNGNGTAYTSDSDDEENAQQCRQM
jgi:DnaJ-class molecular chaperone